MEKIEFHKKIIKRLKEKQDWNNLFDLFNKENSDILKNKKKKIILAGTPLHGNLGDHAIALAEYQLIQNSLSHVTILEIPVPLMLNHAKAFKKIIEKNTILISGGGFIGSLWMDEESLVKEIVKTYPHNEIIIFPQTVYYEKTDRGIKEEAKAKKVFKNHNNLTLYIREKSSYNQAREVFKNNKICFAPDMVFYLDAKQNDTIRNGILLCFRKDKESVFSNGNKDILFKIIRKYFKQEEISHTDTVISRNILPRERELIFERKLKDFLQCKLVITDRLHGLIFATITSTPCIALNNKSNKIKGVYQIIKNNNYIKFIENIDEIDHAIDDLLSLVNYKYDNTELLKKYNKLKWRIQKAYLSS